VLRVLREPFWLRAALVTVLVSVACLLLGRWQWGRHEAKVAVAERVQRNYDAAPATVGQLLPDPTSALPRDTEWRPVRVVGTYLPEATVLARNRPLQKTYGYEVLVPLRPADGGPVLFVDRGWIPNGASGAQPDAVPAPPAGTVTVVARLRPTEPPDDREAPAGQVPRIDVPRIASALGAPAVTQAYGVLVSETPAPATVPAALRAPDGDLGSNLAYAVQWWSGALVVHVLLLVYARKEAVRRGGGPVAPRPRPRVTAAGGRSGRRPRKGLSDEEWEDLADAAADARRRDRVVGGGPVVHDHQPGPGPLRQVDQ
jgi:cytochrome oxidase assembly protein ShyY1